MLNRYTFITPHERAIGNTTEEIYFGLLRARRLGKTLLILRRLTLFRRPLVSNKEAFRISGDFLPKSLGDRFVRWLGCLAITLFAGHVPALWKYFVANAKNLFSFIRNPKGPLPYTHFVYAFPYLQIGLERIWNPGEKRTFNLEDAYAIDWSAEYRKPLRIHVPEPSEMLGRQLLRKMGMSERDWFVCLHNREGGFYNDHHDRRNNRIETYFGAIRAITERGGWVVRMGDATMTRLPCMNQVVDYPFTPHKSEKMDLFLLQECRFFVGQNSGILDTALMFQKPCAVANMTEWCLGFPRNKPSLALLKHYFSKSKNRFLSLEEVMELPFGCQDFSKFDSEFVLVSNTEEDIHAMVVELMDALDRGAFEYSPLQQNFRRKRTEQIHQWLNSEIFSNPSEDRLFRYRIACRASACEGTLSQNYLEKYWKQPPAYSPPVTSRTALEM